MFQMINTMVGWEWQSKMEDEKQSNLKEKSFQNMTEAPQSRQKEHKFNSLTIVKQTHERQGQPVCCEGALDSR